MTGTDFYGDDRFDYAPKSTRWVPRWWRLRLRYGSTRTLVSPVGINSPRIWTEDFQAQLLARVDELANRNVVDMGHGWLFDDKISHAAEQDKVLLGAHYRLELSERAEARDLHKAKVDAAQVRLDDLDKCIAEAVDQLATLDADLADRRTTRAATASETRTELWRPRHIPTSPSQNGETYLSDKEAPR
jgi:hypothetical protein